MTCRTCLRAKKCGVKIICNRSNALSSNFAIEVTRYFLNSTVPRDCPLGYGTKNAQKIFDAIRKK